MVGLKGRAILQILIFKGSPFLIKYIYNQMDNQFINAPLLVNRSVQLDSKDELIKKLELKNNRLKSQLLKIQRTIQQKFNQTEEDDLPRKRESIFQTEDNYEVLTKELANTYKRIKMYEYEVNKLEDGSRSVNLSQKSGQYDLVLKEKRAMGDKLRAQLLKVKRAVEDNTRRLEKNTEKNELQSYVKKLTEEANFYREKIKYVEEVDKTKAANMKKQYEHIKKMENTLLEGGVAGGELEDLKRNAIKAVNGGGAPRKEQDPVEGKPDDEEEVEERTKEAYEVLLGEVALLEKMQNDHERQMVQAFDEKIEAINKNMGSRNRLLQCENQIENLEKEVQVMKGKVVPSNMKPLRPIRSLSSHQGEQLQKLLPAKSIGSSLTKNKALTHLLKYDEVGLPSAKGQRFTDRLLLGKNNLTAKITGVKVFIDQETELIAGIQCTYSGNKRGGEHVRKDKDQREKQYREEEFVCRGSSFIRSVTGTLNGEDKLQFLQLNSSDGSSFRVSTAKSATKSFNLEISADEYPTCIFGSLLITKQPGKKQKSVVEHIGFEIQGDSMNSHSAVVNEFDL